MTGEFINTDGIGSALIYVADKVGITVEQMYQIYLRSQVIIASVQIIFIVTALLVGIIVGFACYYKFKKECDKDEIFELYGVSLICGVIAVGIVGCILAVLYNPVIAYLCPEYTALKSLMADIGTMVTVIK